MIKEVGGVVGIFGSVIVGQLVMKGVPTNTEGVVRNIVGATIIFVGAYASLRLMSR